MSTPELEQAIAASKWRGAEQDVQEVLAKMFGTDPEVVARIVYAWETLKDKKLVAGDSNQFADLFHGLGCGDTLNDEIRSAIEHTAARAWRRIAIRWRMERNLYIEVPFNKLVSIQEPSRMCDGCSWQLECVRDMLSTPEQCLRGKHVYCKDQYDGRPMRMFQHNFASVLPLKLDDVVVTVRAEHPRGTFVINVMDVRV